MLGPYEKGKILDLLFRLEPEKPLATVMGPPEVTLLQAYKVNQPCFQKGFLKNVAFRLQVTSHWGNGKYAKFEQRYFYQATSCF